MQICLIKPSILHKGASFALLPTPPLGLAYIAGALESNGHSLQVIDASAVPFEKKALFRGEIFRFGLSNEEIINEVQGVPEVFCLSLMFTNNWLHDRELIHALKVKFANAIIIAGGEHATAAPNLCLRQAPLDFVVLGEGEETIVDLINCLKSGENLEDVGSIAFLKEEEFFQTTRRKRIKEIEKIQWPAWHLFPLDAYFENKMSHGVYRGRTLPVMATRGCPYECTFCSSPLMWGRNYSLRSPSDFVDELEFLNRKYQVINFDLYDLTAIIIKKWILETCREIVKRGLKITFQLPSGTRAEAIDFEVASALKSAGCSNITYAPESGSFEVLKKVKKKVKIEKMLTSIKHSNRAGINIHLNMIIGFPQDQHRDIFQTLWFLIRCSWNGANDMAMAVFTPYPGSEIFADLNEKGALDLFDDQSLVEIIDSYDLWPSKVYSENISPIWIKMYILLSLIVFYSSNYLFRPNRFFKTIINVVAKKHESRLEQILYKNFIRNLVSKNFIKTSSVK
jgi:anaerobic magnesium-protoporphyrin IX monomethyl ester cyclase